MSTLVPGGVAARPASVVPRLVRPTVHATAWGHLITGGALTVLLVLVSCGEADLAANEVVTRIRIAMLALAVGVAGTLDDATRPHLDSVPARLVVRQTLRVVVALTVTTGWWTLALLSAEYHPMLGHHRPRDVPVTALSIEVAGLVAVTLAVAAVVSRSRATSGTLPAAGAALGVPAGVLTWAPLRHALFPRYEPGIDPAWLAAHQRWLAVAVAAAAVLAWALRDPARRALPRRPSRHRPAHDTGAHR